MAFLQTRVSLSADAVLRSSSQPEESGASSLATVSIGRPMSPTARARRWPHSAEGSQKPFPAAVPATLGLNVSALTPITFYGETHRGCRRVRSSRPCRSHSLSPRHFSLPASRHLCKDRKPHSPTEALCPQAVPPDPQVTLGWQGQKERGQRVRREACPRGEQVQVVARGSRSPRLWLVSWRKPAYGPVAAWRVQRGLLGGWSLGGQGYMRSLHLGRHHYMNYTSGKKVSRGTGNWPPFPKGPRERRGPPARLQVFTFSRHGAPPGGTTLGGLCQLSPCSKTNMHLLMRKCSRLTSGSHSAAPALLSCLLGDKQARGSQRPGQPTLPDSRFQIPGSSTGAKISPEHSLGGQTSEQKKDTG